MGTHSYLDEIAFNVVTKDVTFLQKVNDKGKNITVNVVDAIADTLIYQDKKPMDKISGYFASELNSQIKQVMDASSQQLAAEVTAMYNQFKTKKKELSNFQIKTSGKVAISVFKITFSTATAVLSGGGMAPLAIYSLVKDSLAIVQDVLKLASTCSSTKKVITADLAVLKKIMREDITKASTGAQLGQHAKTIGLEVVSKAIGLETPSLKNLKSHIDLFVMNITKLEKKSNELSTKLNTLLDATESWNNDYNKAKMMVGVNSIEIGKIRIKLDAGERNVGKIIETVIDLNESVEKYVQQGKDYNADYDLMKVQYTNKKLETAMNLFEKLIVKVATVENMVDPQGAAEELKDEMVEFMINLKTFDKNVVSGVAESIA